MLDGLPGIQGIMELGPHRQHIRRIAGILAMADGFIIQNMRLVGKQGITGADLIIIDHRLQGFVIGGVGGGRQRQVDEGCSGESKNKRMSHQSDSRNLISAARSRAESSVTAVLAASASPPCQRIASKRLRARPSCRK
eukprot:NODE_10801_length_478_cov_0.772080_g10778_i0.p1 GENE.NODE_10801_length_478_cov_0.772080_g10778_i0~~NODE_10801_length_478_cov_0.772080_g10778_i0.p1  ORF type:complete len:138 (-),score=1.79 NODE_10801_length_478_cov_0.772080_g10778_i0:65-478(-)